MADADLDYGDIDFVSVGVYNNGFGDQGFEAALVGAGLPELAHVPAQRVENACATGSAALFAAADRIEAGRAKAALVIGAERMSGTPPEKLNAILLTACHRRTEAVHGSFAGIFAHLAELYTNRFGDPREAMAAIAAKNHRNGVDNPLAHFRRDLGVRFCTTESDRNPLVARPLLRTDCAPVSDGAAALVVTSAQVATKARRAVVLRSRTQCNDHLALASRRDPLAFDGAAAAFRHTLNQADITASDLDLLETHDCFTIAELLQMEAFGLADPGKGADLVLSGATQRDGVLPVNVSGGLKAKGHPLGATGVSQHVMAAMQIAGEAGDMQLPHVEHAAVFNMGGAAVANYATVLQAARVSGAAARRGLVPRRAVNLATLLTQTSRRMPNRDALIHGTCRWTWSELDARVTALSQGLTHLGVRPGDCVLLDGPNHAEFVQSLFAIWRTGAVVAPVNARLHTSEIAEIARVCQPTVIIAHASTSDHVDAVRRSRGHIPALYMGDAPTDSPDVAVSDVTADQLGRCPPAAANAPVFVGDPAWYFFTSGTSGAPKAAVLTHDHLGYIVTNHIADLMPTTDHHHRSLAIAPLSHGAGVHLLPQVARGAATIIPASASLDPAEVWALVEREQVTNMFTVPTILTRLVDHPAARSHRHSSLAYVIYAGAPMARADQQRARSVIGDVLVQYYGLVEVTGNITVLPRDQHDRSLPADLAFGSCGYPRLGMDVSIQDDDGNELPPFESGEICVCGPGVFAGYLNNPQADAAAFRDGWFRTGDIGLLDNEGYLYITGRASDMYISGGSNIHPRPIEEKLLTHPAIREAVVLGMPDPSWGEVGVAVCVAEPGHAVDERVVREWLAARMARFQIPRSVVFWESLPRTGYGKVSRREVRAELQARGWEPPPSATVVPEQEPRMDR